MYLNLFNGPNLNVVEKGNNMGYQNTRIKYGAIHIIHLKYAQKDILVKNMIFIKQNPICVKYKERKRNQYNHKIIVLQPPLRFLHVQCAREFTFRPFHYVEPFKKSLVGVHNLTFVDKFIFTFRDRLQQPTQTM